MEIAFSEIVLKSYYWYDLETSGTDPRTDRILQFAGQRTDLTLVEKGAPRVLYCRLPDDVLPDPEAITITGITPQQVEREGVDERAFSAGVEAELSVAETCVVGYNSLRFDDQFIRHLLYRNFYDAYAREWREGNSRWDILDLARTAGALRPEGIHWPRDENEHPVFRLAALAEANGIAHERAHDALSDVRATIGVARLIKQRQPRLFDYNLRLRDRRFVESLLLPLGARALVHVSGRFARERHCLALVATLARHPVSRNAYVVWDLSLDPEPLLTRSSDEVRELLSTPGAERNEGAPPIGLKLVRTNRCPSLAPLSVVRQADRERLGLDVERALRHLRWIQSHAELAEKLQTVYREGEPYPQRDVEGALYDGFIGDDDRDLFPKIRGASAAELAASALEFHDPRLPELLFRYRARNFADSLNAEERARWHSFVRSRLTGHDQDAISLQTYFERLERLRSDSGDETHQKVLAALFAHGRTMTLRYGVDA